MTIVKKIIMNEMPFDTTRSLFLNVSSVYADFVPAWASA